MANDLAAMRPIEVCRLLNSTPLGEVLTEQRLRNHRTRAGLRIGGTDAVHLLKYVGWLAAGRHCKPEPKPGPGSARDEADDGVFEAALGAVGAVSVESGRPLTAKQVRALAALFTEPSYAAAARKAGVAESSLYRWLHEPAFRSAYDDARRALVASSLGRAQAASVTAVNTLIGVARHGRRDGDRLRAAKTILDHGRADVPTAGAVRSPRDDEFKKADAGELVGLLSERIRQLRDVTLPVAEATRLETQLSNALLRAIEADTVNQRIEALEAVLKVRKEKP